MKRPHCFIAMAFGNKDTDLVYKKYIKPTVNKCGFTPRRIDRVLHNDYIDRKIIEEIGAADICVADLTYARPSVYFEAGYALRKIPVLFTCRRDHFSNTEDTLKVHFDLRQRNIIPWDNESDGKFCVQFERRFQHISRPMLLTFHRGKKLEKEREVFRTLSSHHRQRLVNNAFSKILDDRDYMKQIYKPTFFYKYAQIDQQYLPIRWFYYKKVGRDLIVIHDILYEKFTKKYVADNMQEVREARVLLEMLPKSYLKNVLKIRYIILFISLNRFNKDNLQDYTALHKNPFDSYYISETGVERRIFGKDYSMIEEFGIFDRIRSVPEINRELETFMENIKA